MKKINIAEKSFNPFDQIGQKWMLISAGESRTCCFGKTA